MGSSTSPSATCIVLLLIRLTSATTADVTSATNDTASTVTDSRFTQPRYIQLQFTAEGQLLEFNLTRSFDVNDVTWNNDDLKVLIGERGRIESWDNSNTSQSQYAVYEDMANRASFARVVCLVSSQIKYMGTFSWNGTMHALKPCFENGLSQIPYDGRSVEVAIDNVTYRMIPVDTILNFTDTFMHSMSSTTTTSPRPTTSHRPGTRSANFFRRCVRLRRRYWRRYHKHLPTKRCRRLLRTRHNLVVIRYKPLRSVYRLRRPRRQATQLNYTVNMLVVVDYAIYYRWYIESSALTAQAKRMDALQNIVYYYSNIINGVNMRYASIVQPDFSISVRIASIYVATTPTDSPFTEGADVKIGISNVETYTTLVRFQSYVDETLRPLIQFDQATLFTGYGLLVRYSDGSTGTISGLAYIQGICRSTSVSINHEAGEYSSIQTAAHELGHNLGAQHDGFGNGCSSSDQFIMATGAQTLTDGIFNHPFNFSTCSIEYFRSFLSPSTASCLFHSSSNVTINPPSGQRFNADKQCQIIYGPGSFYCAGGLRDRSICREMQCWDPEYGECVSRIEQRAFDGTTCGNHMWCMWGKCVHNDLAPVAPDSCIYGDYRDTFKLSASVEMNCSMIGAKEPFRCYDLSFSMDCCNTCSVIRTNVTPGCEYGDNDWIGRCARILRRDCYEPSVRDSCCSTCNALNNRLLAPIDCAFGDRADWCATVTADGCYSGSSSTCCESCRQYSTGVPGCEYGDRVGWCPSYAELDCRDQYYANLCCGTCMSKSSSSVQPVSTSSDSQSTTPTVTTKKASIDDISTNVFTTTMAMPSTIESTVTMTASPPLDISTMARSTIMTVSKGTTLGVVPTTAITTSLTTATKEITLALNSDVSTVFPSTIGITMMPSTTVGVSRMLTSMVNLDSSSSSGQNATVAPFTTKLALKSTTFGITNAATRTSTDLTKMRLNTTTSGPRLTMTPSTKRNVLTSVPTTAATSSLPRVTTFSQLSSRTMLVSTRATASVSVPSKTTITTAQRSTTLGGKTLGITNSATSRISTDLTTMRLNTTTSGPRLTMTPSTKRNVLTSVPTTAATNSVPRVTTFSHLSSRTMAASTRATASVSVPSNTTITTAQRSTTLGGKTLGITNSATTRISTDLTTMRLNTTTTGPRLTMTPSTKRNVLTSVPTTAATNSVPRVTTFSQLSSRTMLVSTRATASVSVPSNTTITTAQRSTTLGGKTLGITNSATTRISTDLTTMRLNTTTTGPRLTMTPSTKRNVLTSVPTTAATNSVPRVTTFSQLSSRTMLVSTRATASVSVPSKTTITTAQRSTTLGGKTLGITNSATTRISTDLTTVRLNTTTSGPRLTMTPSTKGNVLTSVPTTAATNSVPRVTTFSQLSSRTMLVSTRTNASVSVPSLTMTTMAQRSTTLGAITLGITNAGTMKLSKDTTSEIAPMSTTVNPPTSVPIVTTMASMRTTIGAISSVTTAPSSTRQIALPTDNGSMVSATLSVERMTSKPILFPSAEATTLQFTTADVLPPRNLSCPFGDGASFCSTIPAVDCYNYEQLCCATCQNYYTGTPGCEYGDRAGWCSSFVQTPNDCIREDDAINCCQTCAEIKLRTIVPTCTDQAEWCTGIFPGYCYDSSVESTCCAQCSKVRTNNTACQYGDLFVWCGQQYCSQNALECCVSCKS